MGNTAFTWPQLYISSCSYQLFNRLIMVILGRNLISVLVLTSPQHDFVGAFQGTIQYNKKFGAHSHLLGNGLYSICSLMVLTVPRSHTLVRLKHQKYLPTCTKLHSLVLPLHVQSYDVIHTITVEAVVISKSGLYETSY